MTNVEKRIDVGGCRASIFTTEIHTNAGKVPLKNVTLARVFQGRDGQLKSAYSFRANDIPKAILALARSYEYLIENADKRSKRDDGNTKLGRFIFPD